MNILVVIAGGTVQDIPQLRTAPSGIAVCNFTLEVRRSYVSKGAQKDEVELVPVVAFGKTAESCNEYLERGQQALVRGRLSTRSWEKDGARQQRTEVVAEDVQFGAKGSKGAASTPATPKPAAAAAPVKPAPKPTPAPAPYPTAESEGIDPADIPF